MPTHRQRTDSQVSVRIERLLVKSWMTAGDSNLALKATLDVFISVHGPLGGPRVSQQLFVLISEPILDALSETIGFSEWGGVGPPKLFAQ